MKKYTVWVGATEVNDYYLNKTKAKDLENKYKSLGYDDVKIEIVTLKKDK